jgi:hypothetical protein
MNTPLNHLSPLRYATAWLAELWQAWNRFWFTPALPHTLALIRITAGAMLFYTHLVWSLDLMAFLGPQSWVNPAAIREIHSGMYTWSYLWYVESPAVLWFLHLVALLVFAALTVGWHTRVVSIAAAVITLSYCHRLTGSLFGLDQINAMLALYLAVGSSGDVFSVDRWRAARATGATGDVPATISSNLAVRLIQLHMCVIYLFGGIGKMRGELWWDGSASWFALANLEYQSWDLTWLVRYPFILALATHLTVFWETFYPFLIWPRLTRPLTLAMAVAVHGGIALFLGMPTFGLVMLIGNGAFLSPEWVRGVVGHWRGEGEPAAWGVARSAAARAPASR